MRALAERQRAVMAANRFGIPAQVHEEILTGLAAWQATIFPSPLCWAASFDPALVETMGARIGETMRTLGIHQGMAPVLDVVRDLRWGRVEETMGEDPFLVGLIGSAYVRGVQSAGVVATAKHFAGYSASRAARNLAPVSMGPRELTDMIVPPFEMTLRAGVRSVMNSYTDLDGVPTAADPAMLTDLLRDTLGFTGTVAADYFSIAFLETLHHVAASPAEAARLALTAGIDVELPSVNTYGEPLLSAVADGVVDEKLVDRALHRVLAQKCELGLLDARLGTRGADRGRPRPAGVARGRPRAGAALGGAPRERRHPAAARGHPRRRGRASRRHARGDGGLLLLPACTSCCTIPGSSSASTSPRCGRPWRTPSRSPTPRAARSSVATDEDIAAAVAHAAQADVCVAVLGDEAGLFGNGTSGEGCDVTDLRLPGRQEELLEALLGTGTPSSAVLLVGRPYDLSRQADAAGGAGLRVLPGGGGRSRRGRRPQRSGQPCWPASGGLPRRRLVAALDLSRRPRWASAAT